MDILGDYETDKFEGIYQISKFGIYERGIYLKFGTKLDWIKSKERLSPIWSKIDPINPMKIFIFFNTSKKRWEVHEMMLPEISMTRDHFHCQIGLMNSLFYVIYKFILKKGCLLAMSGLLAMMMMRKELTK